MTSAKFYSKFIIDELQIQGKRENIELRTCKVYLQCSVYMNIE
jgi:hypothetical protein